MEATVTPEQIDAMNLDLDEPSMADEVTVKLTRGQLIIINAILAEHIQPKGYEHIAFAYDLFTRLQEAISTLEKTEEAIE